MKKYLLTIIILITGCSEQPTETEKTLLERKLSACAEAINEDPSGSFSDSDGDLFQALKVDFLKPQKVIEDKRWAVTNEGGRGRTITAKFQIDIDIFSCGFLAEDYSLLNVERNGETIFNHIENDLIRKQKNERLISTWTEHSYSNTDYKYYKKRHSESKIGNSSPLIKVNCKPNDRSFQYETDTFNWNDRAVEFIFTSQTGSESLVLDIGSGNYIPSKKSKIFAEKLKKAAHISVDGFKFNIDDISSISCLTEAYEIEQLKRKERDQLLKEERRLADIKNWHEESYSNVGYKGYLKKHIKSTSAYNEPQLKVICDPEQLRIKFDDKKIRIIDRENILFMFYTKESIHEERFDLTSDGVIGKANSDNPYFTQTFWDGSVNKKFLKLMEQSEKIEVFGLIFNMDNIKDIPCMN